MALAALFETMDYNKEGRVPVEHVERALHWASGSHRSTIIQLDSTSNEPLHLQLRDALIANSVRVIELFREWDEDGNGEISRGEFYKALPLLGVSPRREVVDELFDLFDADASGAISFREFNKVLKQGDSKSSSKNSLSITTSEDVDVVSLMELKREVMRECCKLRPPPQFEGPA